MIDPPTPPPEPLAEPEVDAAHENRESQRARARNDAAHERWRDRLVSGGKDALHEFTDQHPMADLTRLRDLLRQARRRPGSGKSTQALAQILQVVREVCEIEASVRKAASRP